MKKAFIYSTNEQQWFCRTLNHSYRHTHNCLDGCRVAAARTIITFLIEAHLFEYYILTVFLRKWDGRISVWRSVRFSRSVGAKRRGTKFDAVEITSDSTSLYPSGRKQGNLSILEFSRELARRRV